MEALEGRGYRGREAREVEWDGGRAEGGWPRGWGSPEKGEESGSGY